MKADSKVVSCSSDSLQGKTAHVTARVQHDITQCHSHGPGRAAEHSHPPASYTTCSLLDFFNMVATAQAPFTHAHLLRCVVFESRFDKILTTDIYTFSGQTEWSLLAVLLLLCSLHLNTIFYCFSLFLVILWIRFTKSKIAAFFFVLFVKPPPSALTVGKGFDVC